MTEYDRWQQGRRERLQAKLDADAARRHAARIADAQSATEAQEARLKAAIDEAVKVAVKDMLGGGTPLSESAPPDAHAPAPVPDGPTPAPLHQLTPEGWGEHATQYWADRLRPLPSPLTLGELLGVQPEDDGAA